MKATYYKTPEVFTRESNECACDECMGMCAVACCCSPQGAQRLIDAGFGDCLEREYYEDEVDGKWQTLWVLQVKTTGGFFAPCAMQEKDGKCKLHGPLKPIEAKLATCNAKHDPFWVKHNVRNALVYFWDSDEGIELLKLYEEK